MGQCRFVAGARRWPGEQHELTLGGRRWARQAPTLTSFLKVEVGDEPQTNERRRSGRPRAAGTGDRAVPVCADPPRSRPRVDDSSTRPAGAPARRTGPSGSVRGPGAGFAGHPGPVDPGSGRLVQDPSKPDGTLRKLLDVSRINDLGWKAKVPLREGILATYQWFLEHRSEMRG